MYLRILFTVFQYSSPGFTLYQLTAHTACAISNFVHIIVNIKLPIADTEGIRDISFLSTLLLEYLLEDNLKLTGSEVEISIQSCMLKRHKIFFK